MNRKEKEEYLVITCDKNGFRKDDKYFREGVSHFSDEILDLKIEMLKEILEEE